MVDIRTTIEIGINDLVEGIIRQEPQWSSDSNTRLAKGIARQVVECCHKVTHEYKFTAVCVLSKKTEVSPVVDSACIWDSSTDFYISVFKDTEEYFCVLNLYASYIIN